MTPRPFSDTCDFSVLDETADWIVVDKPAPLQVHPSRPDGGPTLWHGLRELLRYELENGGSLSIINRLDRDTSGIVLVAKHKAAARILHKAMMRREVAKEYRAIVWGWPESDAFTVEQPILRRSDVEESPIFNLQQIHPEGAPARTEFQVLERFEKATTSGTRFSLVAARPFTGRMHQIRVHLGARRAFHRGGQTLRPLAGLVSPADRGRLDGSRGADASHAPPGPALLFPWNRG